MNENDHIIHAAMQTVLISYASSPIVHYVTVKNEILRFTGFKIFISSVNNEQQQQKQLSMYLIKVEAALFAVHLPILITLAPPCSCHNII